MHCPLLHHLWVKPAIHLSSNWREDEKMLAKQEKWEVYRWHFVNHLANHFTHLTFRHSHQTIIFSQNVKEDDGASFASSFSQNQRWTKSAILWELWEVYSDWFAISRNSARTCRNARTDNCVVSFRPNDGNTFRNAPWNNLEQLHRKISYKDSFNYVGSDVWKMPISWELPEYILHFFRKWWT